MKRPLCLLSLFGAGCGGWQAGNNAPQIPPAKSTAATATAPRPINLPPEGEPDPLREGAV